MVNLWREAAMATAFTAGFFLGFGISQIYYAHGAEFHYNLTKRMQDEGKLVEFCSVNTTIKIPELDKKCALIYGKLNSSYGESVDKK